MMDGPLMPTLHALIDRGVRVIRDPASTLPYEAWAELQRRSPEALLVGSYEPLLEPALPAVTIVPGYLTSIPASALACPPHAPWQLILAHPDQKNVDGQALDFLAIRVHYASDLPLLYTH